MSEEEKVHFRNKLFREAEEINDKIAFQIEDIKQVREEIQEQISDNNELLNRYHNEMEDYSLRMDFRKQVYQSSSILYNDMTVKNLEQYKRKGGHAFGRNFSPF